MGKRNEGISNARITLFLRKHPKTKSIFLNAVACNSTQKRSLFPYAMVMTTDDFNAWISNAPGHWVALYLIDKENAEYFDSAGMPPNTCILEYLKEYSNIKKSSEELQAFSAATCGFYCMYFILMRSYGKTFEEIIEKLKLRGINRDIYVKVFIEEIEKWLNK